MQTTLLGLAIAFILALLAALVGPFFIDWSQFRTQFEREVARATGMQVRVDGKIDARLLPTPSLSLRDVAIGERLDANNLSVEKLDVEFSLGDLMRGEWRATELSLNGLVLEVGLDDAGRMKWNAAPGNFNLGGMTVDRFSVTGAIAILDAASNTSIRFDNLAFAGEVRGVAGSVRGEGAATFRGTRYPFRLATGRASDGNAQRVRLNVDPLNSGFAIEADGLVSLQDSVPRFDGALTAGRSVVAKSGKLDTAIMPWRMAAKIKADLAAARLEQLETVYGPDDFGLKLSGEGSIRFGSSPLLRTSLSARQIDVDRFFTQTGMTALTPGELLVGMRQIAQMLPRMPLASEIGVDIDAINFGPRPIQNFDLELKANGHDWSIDTLQFRAPGGSRVNLTGKVADVGDKANFSGDVKLDVNDPTGLALWLQGAIDNTYRSPQPLRATGSVKLSRDLVAIDGLKAEIDSQPFSGRLSLATATDGKSKLDAHLQAQKLDAGITANFLKALGSLKQTPGEASLALDIGQLDFKDQIVKPVNVLARYSAEAIVIERLKIGDADGVAIEGTGSFNRIAATGQLNLSATSASLDPLSRLLAPVVPALSKRLATIPEGAGNVWAGLVIDLEKGQNDRAGVRAALDIRSPQINGALTASLSPRLDVLQSLDIDALAKDEATITGKLSAAKGRAVLALLGLDQVFGADDKPMQFEASAKGAWGSPLAIKAKLVGDAFDGDIDGRAEPFRSEPSASLNVAIRKANVAPLLVGAPRTQPLNASVATRLGIAGRQWTFDGVDVVLAGSRIRGKLQMLRGQNANESSTLDGDIGIDSVDMPAVMLAALGAPSSASTEPFAKGPLAGLRGRVAFSSLKASLGALDLRPLNGVIRSDGQSVTLENLSANLGGGQVTGDVTARTTAEGTGLTGRVQLTAVDGAVLRYRNLSMPTGRVSAQVSLNGNGRSPSALMTALSGTGAVTIEKAAIPGLDPRAFDAALQASDQGTTRDDMMLGAIVAPALAGGALPVALAEIPFTLRDGQLRVSNTAIEGEGAQLTLAGGYDITADQIDIRAALGAAKSGAAGIGRPEITVLLFGSPDKLERTVDVAALSSWLGLRAIDRETKRLDAIEKTNPLLNPQQAPAISPASPPASADPQPRDAPSRAVVTPATPQAPRLPPPIEVKPAPAIPRQPPKNAPLVITPNRMTPGQRPSASP